MKGPKKNSKLEVSPGWTLFLDRDGIINKNIDGDYVRSWDQFKFLPHFLKIIPKLSKIFTRIVIVTNQRCIGRKIITPKRLREIHKRMLLEIKRHGGKIDALYYCPHNIEDGCTCRKPRPGMVSLARKNFKDINLKKSIMLGDSPTDMEMGKEVGMTTVLIAAKTTTFDTKNADFIFKDLGSWFKTISTKGR